jgi:DNA gyrase subunit A
VSPCIRGGLNDRAAVPEVRDGLTLAGRCTLRALHAVRTRDRTYVKSTRVVAEALRRHPPGVSSEAVAGAAIYDELVAMAQGFRTRYPLVDGQGNFGSGDDDPPGDQRYTQARLTPLAGELLAETDGGDSAVGALSAPYPNLLVNGAFAVAPRALTRLAPHNLAEVVAATLAYMDDPGIGVAGLMAHLPAPDFPTGGILLDRGGIADAYATGRGRLWLRGRARFETVPRGRQLLVVTELPYGVTKGGELGFVSEVAGLVRAERISGIAGLEDHSSERGMRIVITLSRDAEPAELLARLLAQTQLQTSFLMKIVAGVGVAPRTLTLKEAIAHWLADRRAGRADDVIREQLRELAARHGDARRTDVSRAGAPPPRARA